MPAIKHGEARESIDLYRPDIEKLALKDYPITQVLEERSSIREYAQTLSDGQLREFLFRTARVKNLLKYVQIKNIH